MEVGLDVMLNLPVLRLYVPRDIEVVVVLLAFYLGPFNHTAVVRDVLLGLPGVHDTLDVLLPEAVLRTVLHETLLGVDEEDAFAGVLVLLVDDDNRCRDASTEEDVCRKSDDSLDETLPDDILPYLILCVAPEEDSVREDARSAALLGLHRVDKMEQERVVSALGRREQVAGPPVVRVVLQTGGEPVLQGERRIGDAYIEGADHALLPELRVSEGITDLYLGVAHPVQEHVQLGERGGTAVLLLTADGYSVVARLRERAKQERSRTAGRVIDGLIRPVEFLDTEDLRHDAAHLGRGVELPLALAALGGEVLHQVFVCVTEKVVIRSPVPGEVQGVILEHTYQARQRVHHRPAAAELDRVVEVRKCKVADLTGIGLLDRFELLVHELTDLVVLLECYEVPEGAPLGNTQAHPRLAGLVGEVFDEKDDEDVVLVLTGVHRAAKGVAGLPESAV